MMSSRKKERGAAFLLVMVLLGVLGILGVSTLKNSMTQLNIASQNIRMDKNRMAVDSGIECVLSEFLTEGVSHIVEHLLVLKPELIGPISDVTKGCRKRKHGQSQSYQFNETIVTTLQQYCGEASEVATGSDLAFFFGKRYLISAAGFNQESERMTPIVQQAVVLNTVEMQHQFSEQIQMVEHNGKTVVLSARETCSPKALFAGLRSIW